MTSQETKQQPRDRIWFLLLGLAALLLFCIDLGGVPLRDWDEGTVAQVAREISLGETWTAWLHPQLWGQPYLNKPPLLHGLVAVAFDLFGVHTWAARLPGAVLTATSVPLLLGLGRELLPTRLCALMGTGVYLTFLPVVRHGRLAMLDGAVVCFFIALLWMLMRSRRHPRWYVGVGVCFALMCLTKGMLGVLLLAIALLFLAWDAPKELRSPWLWGSLLIGTLPVIGWYLLQWQYYGQQFLDVTLFNQNLERIWNSVDNHQGPPWYYLLELLKYSWPWLIFWPVGLRLTWKSRHQSWAKLLLVWTVVYLTAISIMGTKLPWYLFPIYPAIALTAGIALSAAWNMYRHWNGRGLSLKRLPRVWSFLLALFSFAGVAGLIYASPWGGEPSIALQFTFLTVAIATGLAALFILRQQTRFVPTLLVGLYIALVGLVMSDHWVWELGESFPVLPVADLVHEQIAPKQPVYIAYGYDRPSLDFYSDRRVVAQPLETLLAEWQQSQPIYLLVEDPAPFQANSVPLTELGKAENWHLITNQS
ncbi:glycosyltransferase family 39 protein [Oscillatoria sp. CS-180]|uniref:ArnT family glycosyltransferase n=1 Tax=Oscillatoria sp. CS-180 TaxID=3021720 RepID=UPI0023304ECE|nr:glycosyltransferase family 39 protein [Oscillatoria sp. CS-180]MDB9527685.1 glycosyltransferase family 39 protein [Oscillatoria sp. CS-180]